MYQKAFEPFHSVSIYGLMNEYMAGKIKFFLTNIFTYRPFRKLLFFAFSQCIMRQDIPVHFMKLETCNDFKRLWSLKYEKELLMLTAMK